jgi:hypothetical protein
VLLNEPELREQTVQLLINDLATVQQFLLDQVDADQLLEMVSNASVKTQGRILELLNNGGNNNRPARPAAAGHTRRMSRSIFSPPVPR